MIQIIYKISLHFFLNYTFLKYVIISHYIHIYIYIYITQPHIELSSSYTRCNFKQCYTTQYFLIECEF